MSRVPFQAHKAYIQLSRQGRPRAVPLDTSCVSTSSARPFSVASKPSRTHTGNSRSPIRPQLQLRNASTAASPADSNPSNDADPTQTRTARAVRGGMESLAEPYVAERATETLFKECARQADYIVPQAFEKNVEIPTNKEGEHIGEGTGWWYESKGLRSRTRSASRLTTR